MEGLLSIQEDILQRINKAKINYKKCSKEKKTVPYVETRLENLVIWWTQFNNNHQEIIKLATTAELKQNDYFKLDKYELVEELFVEFKSELKLLLDSNSQKKPETIIRNNESVIPTAQPQIKLPKIIIPIFSGNYIEWPTFRDLFTSLVHNNPAIDDVQKLHYLKGYLQGEAEQLLRNIPISSANYKRCWDMLSGRYNNKKFLSHHIIKRLLSQKNATTESSTFLKELLDTSTDCLNALSNIGVDVSNWDILVIHLLTLKLDPESRKQWELNVATNNATDDLPTFEQFKEFLNNRYRALEFLDSGFNKRQPSNVQSAKPKVFHVTQFECILCKENHKIHNCKKFIDESVEMRRNFVLQNHLCFNCLSANHTAKECSSSSCRICKRKHHSLLHPKPDSIEQSGSNPEITVALVSTEGQNDDSIPSTSNEEPTQLVSHFSSTGHNQVILATALVQVISRNGSTHLLRALLDQGSQASFVTEAAAQLLGLRKTPIQGVISGLEGNKNVSCKSKVSLNVLSNVEPNISLDVQAYVLKNITSVLPNKKINIKQFNEFQNIALADPQFCIPNKIDLLLGAEIYSQIIKDGVKRNSSGTLLAQCTTLGWIVSGTVDSANSLSAPIVMHLRLDETDILKRFWELENDSISTTNKKLSDEEIRCEEIFVTTTNREDGRYVVSLPFKNSDPQCQYGNSRDIASKKFQWLEKRFSKNLDFKNQYSAVIQEYLDLQHMEVVPDSLRDNPKAVYLPHHAVIREDKTTTKMRIVFNASSAGTNGVSLNDDLLVGPRLQPELRHIIMGWRTYPICLIADIIKMYRQIKVDKKHVDYQRILWRENNKDELQHLRLLRVTFGTASAPYLAVRCMQQLAYDEGVNFPDAAERVLKDFYMDDLMTGCHSIEEGKRIYRQMTELLEKGGFVLQKWSSNNETLLKEITEGKDKENRKEKERGSINEKTSLELKMDEVMKILGLSWNRSTDEFYYTVKLMPVESPITKRKVVSDIARLFDPLGWLAPIIIKAKIFIQKLWLSGINWDDELPPQLLKEWLNYRNNLTNLTEFKLFRWIKTSNNDVVQELHGFCDASSDAYAAVVYSRVVTKSGDVHVSLITSKTKVAPIKQISIPRLELCGAVLVTRLLNEVAEVMKIDKRNLYAWTDSSVVLAWLNSQPNRWKTFVANRVSEILTSLEPHQWSHVTSKNNPADCASRGTTDLQKEHIWIEGPEWLKNKHIKFTKINKQDTQLEEKTKVFYVNCNNENEEEILTRFSSLRRMLRVISLCKRFVKLCRRCTVTPWITRSEIEDSLNTCIKLSQKTYLVEDIQNLKTNKAINKKSILTSVNPFLDKNEILRVGGRLQHAQINDTMKHPIIVPKNSHLSNMLITDAHERTLHGGPQLMLNYLRTRYWIINAKNLVRSYVRKCVTCVRYAALSRNQLMGQLPSVRGSVSRPFLKSGVDFAGPINIRTTKGRGHRSYKGYICLFICMSTRAIHLEAVSDLSTQGFLAAFRRFTARRGHCSDLWSDNGTNFVGAARELKILFTQEKSNLSLEIAEQLASNGTEWHFIPPHAPNFGGLWEAGVKSTKYHLKRVIGNSTLTFEEMATLLAQIEACLNSRPISKICDTPNDPVPLTPGHFLVGEPLILVPDTNHESSSISNLRRWQFTQRMMQDFWRRWSHEYLVQFYHRYKWANQATEPSIGDVVLVMEDNLPPANWLYGIIVNKHPGQDGLTRVVSLKCKNNIIKRPISKLCFLPVT